MSFSEYFPDNFSPIGYFRTMNSEQVSLSGENHPIEYLRNMYEDQYEYFTKYNKIKVFISTDLSEDPGEFDLRVFYDKIKDIKNTYGYGFLMGSCSYFGNDDIQRYNLPASIVTWQFSGSRLSVSRNAYQCQVYKFNIFSVGGHDLGIPIEYDTIDKYNTLTFTNNSISIGSLTKTKNNGMSSKNNNFMYEFGGHHRIGSLYYAQQDIQKINFETYNAVCITPTLLKNREDTTALFNNTYTWIGGGQNWQGHDFFGEYADFEKFDFSTESISVPATLTLSYNRSMMRPFNSKIFGYYAGGHRYSPAPTSQYPTIEKIQYDTETQTTLSSLLMLVSYGGSFYTENDGYLLGGINYVNNETLSYQIQKFNYENETVSIVNNSNLSSSKLWQEGGTI
jgi:effector-binding domain-containing protein